MLLCHLELLVHIHLKQDIDLLLFDQLSILSQSKDAFGDLEGKDERLISLINNLKKELECELHLLNGTAPVANLITRAGSLGSEHTQLVVQIRPIHQTVHDELPCASRRSHLTARDKEGLLDYGLNLLTRKGRCRFQLFHRRVCRCGDIRQLFLHYTKD